MTTLIIGSTRLADELVIAFQHGDPDYVRLITGGTPREAEGVVVDHDPGPDSLLAMFRTYAVDAVINAAEPYAEDLSSNVVSACDLARLPVLRAVPPSFENVAGSSRWTWVTSFDAAGHEAMRCPGEVLVALNPLRLAERLGDLGGRTAFIHRRRMSTDPPLPGWVQEPERFRYGVRGALASIDGRNVSLLVVADSGDTEVLHFLEAAEHSGLDVVIVRRPEFSSGVGGGDQPAAPVVTDALSALTWLNSLYVSPDDQVR